jgi:hypothetical protein
MGEGEQRQDDVTMTTMTDENRDLLLSMYLDGELPPDQAREVEEKIRTDEDWKSEYVTLSESETRVSKVVESNWHDEVFTEKVKARVRSLPSPGELPALPRPAPRWRWLLAGLVVVFLAAGTAYLVMRTPPSSGPTPAIPTTHQLAPSSGPAPPAPAAFASAGWSQLGGNPGHTGVALAPGPAVLAAGRFIPFPSSPPGEANASNVPPATVTADGHAYIVRAAPADATQLYSLDLNSGPAEWQACGAALPGRATHPAAILPDGLVVTGTTGRVVQAWNPATRNAVWRKDMVSAVYALCATSDGLVLCSTFQRLVALTGKGEEAWSFDAFGDLQAPVCVRQDGMLVVVSRSGRLAILDRGGKPVAPEIGVTGVSEATWPPVAGEGSAVWVVEPRGDPFALSADGKPGKLELAASNWSTWPLGNGVFAAGNTLHFLRRAKVRLPLEGQIVALAADAGGRVYAAMRDKVYVVETDAEGSVEIPAGGPRFAALPRGEIVRGGLAIFGKRLVATTTEGVQVFE